MPHSSTALGHAVAAVSRAGKFDRLIVITDEQANDRVDAPKNVAVNYMINVATYENAVGFGPWVRIDGWSERVLDYVRSLEALDNPQ
jgi:60 kDa SS-A/Ro ribonucleoprotein